MAFTYDNTLSTPLAQVRFLTGQTVSATSQLEDEEITAVLALQPKVGYAAVLCAEAVARKYADKVDTSHSKLSVSASQRFKQYMQLAKDLRRIAADPFSGAPSRPLNMKMGGRLVSERREMDNRQDAIQPRFKKLVNDHPGYDALRDGEDEY